MIMLLPLLLPILVLVCFLIVVASVVFLWRTLRDPQKRKSRSYWAISCVLLFGVSSSYCMIWAARTHLFWSDWSRSLRDIAQKRQRMILHHTDLQAVLLAGRKMLADTNIPAGHYIFVDQDSTNVPKVIRDLEPGYIWIYEGRPFVDVEMGGGFFHFGYSIYPEGEKGSGTKELLPGLWYHSEDEKVIPPK